LARRGDPHRDHRRALDARGEQPDSAPSRGAPAGVSRQAGAARQRAQRASPAGLAGGIMDTDRRPTRWLRDPRIEHDACGVGFVVNVKGEKSHRIVGQGLEVLRNLTHRGACGCDPLTGDGAGILVQVPDAFLRREAKAARIELPVEGAYGVGMVFLPPEVRQRNECQKLVEKVVRSEGLKLLGWRRVPVDAGAPGPLARTAMPEIRQVFVGPRAPRQGRGTPGTKAQDSLERSLYVIRKRVEQLVRPSGMPDSERFYVPSLSSRTVVYKGLLLPDQIPAFYHDLADPLFVSALA